ncbi:MAG TPA: hypothetical protein VMU62_09645 [Acidobacteriaceae bacterium]|nr:hypothetical protein [Acidobacteriaceae bacterium]
MSFTELTDDDVHRSLRRALWLTGALALVATPVIWVSLGWQSWALFAVGAAISGTGIYEWLQLMAALVARMEVGEGNVAAKPLGPVMAWFFLRMGLAIVLLYGSLKSLDGSIYALLGGLALGLVALLIEAIRLLSRWRS